LRVVAPFVVSFAPLIGRESLKGVFGWSPSFSLEIVDKSG